ncbi:MAG: peptidylprolyl isomerase [Candidatus Eisenbacteria bacterium]
MSHRVALLLVLSLLCLVPPRASAAPSTRAAATQPTPTQPRTAVTKAAPARASRPAPKTPVDGTIDVGQFLPDSFVICRVGPRLTTVRDFVRLYFDSYIEDRPMADSAGRVTFLENIVSKDVLGQIALEVNRPFRFEDRVVMREHEQRTLSNALYRTAVLESLQVTDAEIEREYEIFKWEVLLRHIMFADQATAIRVRREIQRGRISWKQAYERYSLSKGKDKGPDGQLGWTVRGGADLYTARTIFTLGAGGMTEPLEETGGWNVVQVVEKKQGSPPSLDAVREFIRSQLTEAGVSMRARAVRDLVRKQISMKYDSTNIAWAASQFEAVQTVTRGDDGVPNITLNPNIPHFEPADTSRVLARYRDGIFSLGRFFELYHEIQALVRPNVNTPDGFRDQLDAFAFEPYMAQVAIERGLNRDPLVVAQISKKREQILVEHLYSDSVLSRVAIDPQARRKYYQANLKGFVTYASVKFATLWASSKGQADSLATRLRGGEKAEEILAAEHLLGVDRGSIRDRREDEHGEYQKVLFQDLRPGQVIITGPDKVGDYLVLQKLEHNPGRQLSYEEASGFIDENMQNKESERLLKQLVGRHRKKFPIMSRPDLVMRIRLVDPTL